MEERGLFKFAALLLIGLLVLGGLGWILGGDESAEAAPVALRDQPRADDAPPAPAQTASRAAG